jgi:hypothetical protein
MTRKEMLWFAGIVVAVPAVVVTLFILLSYFSLGRDVEGVRKNILAAYEAGDLAADMTPLGDRYDSAFWGSVVVGSWQWDDCLILDMAVNQSLQDRWKLAISPMMSSPDLVDNHPCVGLYKFVSGELEPNSKFYHRYMHGHTVLARYLLPVLGVHNLRLFLSGSLSVVIICVIILAVYRLARGGDLWPHLLFLVTGLSFARFWGLESYAQSLWLGLGGTVVAAFALFLCAVAQRGCTRDQLVLASAVFGCFIMLTEFLTGELPLGLALIIGAGPFVLRPTKSTKQLIASTSMAGVAFCGAAGLCLAYKIALATAVFGPDVLTDVSQRLGQRMGIIETPWEDTSIFMWAFKVMIGLRSLAGGMRILPGASLVLAVIGGLWGLSQIRKLSGDKILRAKALSLALSNVIFAFWVIIFWEHTLTHSRLTDRIFVWTIASGAALCAFGIILRRSSTVLTGGSIFSETHVL